MKRSVSVVSCGLVSLLCGNALASGQAAAPTAAPAGDDPPFSPTETATPTSDALIGAGGTGGAAEPAAAEPSDPTADQLLSKTQSHSDPSLQSATEPPPPVGSRAEAEEGGSGMPAISFRVDPFNWLLGGRLGFELEMEVWKFISVELIPIIVTSETPPWLNYSGHDENLTQHSNGLGPLSGVSVGAGFWFAGKPLNGALVRGFFTNYAYNYQSRINGILLDEVNHVERRLGATIGSYSRFGAFIYGAEVGMSAELNNEERCLDPAEPTDCGELQLRADATSVYNLNGDFHPVYLEGRISLGVAFD